LTSALGKTVCETLPQKCLTQKRAGGMTEGLEHLPSKNEALNSNSSAAKKKKRAVGLEDFGTLLEGRMHLSCGLTFVTPCL
jgi:hypothetical protein